MAFFGGFNPFGGGGGRYPRPQQNQNMRFGLLPLMHPNQMLPRMNQMGSRGGRPPFRGGKKCIKFFCLNYKKHELKTLFNK